MLNYQRVVFLSVCELTHVNPRISGRFPRHFYRKSQASKTKPRHGLTSPEPGLDAVRSKESLKDGSTSNFGISMRFMEIYGDLWRFMEIYGDLWRFMEIYGDLWRFMEMYGDVWRFMEIYGDLWRFMEIYGDLWRFMEIYGDLCMEI